MKITKILSAVAAAAVATSALASVASANFFPWGAGNTTSYVVNDGNSLYGIIPFSTGAGDAPASTLAADYGFELTDIGGVSYTVTVTETDSFGAEGNKLWFDGSIGGGVVASVHSDTDISTYNWDSYGNFWGVKDDALGLETVDATQGLVLETVGDYTYKLTAPINIDDAVNNIDGELVQVRLFMQVWDNAMSEYQVIGCALYDDAGNVLVEMDGQGNPVGGAPAVDAPAAGSDAVDTQAPTTDNKGGSPDTGVEGVAAAAGLAVVAAGAAILSKKRK